MFGGDVSRFVPPTVEGHLKRKLAERASSSSSSGA